MPTINLNATYIVALSTTVVGLLVSQGLVTNGVGKLVTGLAAAFVPSLLAVAHTLFHARVSAAKIAAASTPSVVPVRKVV